MSTPVPFSKIFTAAAKAIGLAAVINTVLFFALTAANMIDPAVGVGPEKQSVGIVPVVFSTVLMSFIGTLVFLAIVRYSANPVKIFTWVCIAVFVITLANPFLAGIPSKMAVALDVLHIAPAYLIWRFLTRSVA